MPVRGLEDCCGFTYWGVNQATGERFSLDDIAQVRAVEGGQYEFTQPIVADDGETISDVIERVAADPNHVVTIIGEDGNPREVVGHEVVYHRDGAVDIDGHPIIADIHTPTELTAEDIDDIPPTEHTNTASIISGYCQDEWCLPDHADIGSIWVTENTRTQWEWTGTQWQPAGGIVEDAANEEPAPVLEVCDYIYNGVPNPVDYNAIEDAMRAVHEATVRGQRVMYPIIEDLNDINPVNTYTIDWNHVQIGVDVDGNPPIHAHVNPVVSYPDNDNTSEVPSEEFADIFEANA